MRTQVKLIFIKKNTVFEEGECMEINSDFHIVYASDNKFAEILGVSMVSLFENNKDANSITLYILDGGISEQNKKRLDEICFTYGRGLPIWIQAVNIQEIINTSVALDRGPLSQYSRLFLARLLPKHLERVLYFDCDIVVNNSLQELWNLNIEGKTIAALYDAFSKYYRKNIGLKSDDIMFNSGVMLIDLKKWKENHVEERLLKFILSKKGKVQQGDQGALNAILSHETFCFEPRFNAVTIFFDFKYKHMMIYRKPPTFYSESQVKMAIDNPVIIHYTTSFLSRRPWIAGSNHMYVDKWLYYKDLTLWKEYDLWKDSIPKLKKYLVKLYNFLPRCFAIRLVGILQAYGRPFMRTLLQR